MELYVGQWSNQFQEDLPRKTDAVKTPSVCSYVGVNLPDKRARRKVYWEGYYFIYLFPRHQNEK